LTQFRILRITRSKAITFIHEYLKEANDQNLELILDKILKNKLYNTIIVPDGWENEDNVIGG